MTSKRHSVKPRSNMYNTFGDCDPTLGDLMGLKGLTPSVQESQPYRKTNFDSSVRQASASPLSNYQITSATMDLHQNLEEKLASLQQENTVLKNKISLLEVVVSSQGEISKLMTEFFHQCFRELAETDFNLLSLATMQAVMNEESQRIFEMQVPRLESMQRLLKH